MRLDDGSRLKEPDAESLLLCALKRTEQRILHKVLIHATAIVRDRQENASVTMLRAHFDAALVAERVARVEYEVGDDILDLLAIHQDSRHRSKFSAELSGGYVVD